MTVLDATTAENAKIIQLTLGSGQHQQWAITETTCPVGAKVVAVESIIPFRLRPNSARDYVLVYLSRSVGSLSM